MGPEGMAKPGGTRGWGCEDVRSEWNYGLGIFAIIDTRESALRCTSRVVRCRALPRWRGGEGLPVHLCIVGAIDMYNSVFRLYSSN